jgi:hypothetical protein
MEGRCYTDYYGGTEMIISKKSQELMRQLKDVGYRRLDLVISVYDNSFTAYNFDTLDRRYSGIQPNINIAIATVAKEVVSRCQIIRKRKTVVLKGKKK